MVGQTAHRVTPSFPPPIRLYPRRPSLSGSRKRVTAALPEWMPPAQIREPGVVAVRRDELATRLDRERRQERIGYEVSARGHGTAKPREDLPVSRTGLDRYHDFHIAEDPYIPEDEEGEMFFEFGEQEIRTLPSELVPTK